MDVAGAGEAGELDSDEAGLDAVSLAGAAVSLVVPDEVPESLLPSVVAADGLALP